MYLGHDVVENLTGLCEVLAQIRWNGDVQDQVRGGNEQTRHIEIRDFITLGGSAVAEFVTGAFLGPCEELDAETDVVYGLFFVFGLTFRQTPCTMVKISVQQSMAETVYQSLVTTPSEMSIDVILKLSLVYDIAIVVVSLTVSGLRI